MDVHARVCNFVSRMALVHYRACRTRGGPCIMRDGGRGLWLNTLFVCGEAVLARDTDGPNTSWGHVAPVEDTVAQ